MIPLLSYASMKMRPSLPRRRRVLNCAVGQRFADGGGDRRDAQKKGGRIATAANLIDLASTGLERLFAFGIQGRELFI